MSMDNIDEYDESESEHNLHLELVKQDCTSAPAIKNNNSIFNMANGVSNFELAQRMSKALATTDLVPLTYRGNIANCMIALELANRINVSPIMIMQNLFIINGKPTWSSQFVIAAINTCGRFSPLKFAFNDENNICYAYATEKVTGDLLKGSIISLDMADKEG